MNDNDWEESDADSEIPDRYCLNDRDRELIGIAVRLLHKTLRAPFTKPAEMVTLAKALHIFTRLPDRSADVTVAISLSGPTRKFGDHEIYHFWSVNVFEEEIEISAGGHFYRPSTGGDAFTSMEWRAQPGCEADYAEFLDQLQLVDDAQPFTQEVAALDLTQPGYKLSVTDEDNPLLDDEIPEA